MRAQLWAVLGALLLLGAAQGGRAEEGRREPGPARCKEGCTKYG